MSMTIAFCLAQNARNGGVWKDNNGVHINAHGGNIISYKGTYYWYGENRSDNGPVSSMGVSCYKSKNMKDWTDCGIVLPVSKQPGSDMEAGCIVERPKVVKNPKTGKFIMWFHLELKGRGYEAARYGVATADNPLGPFKFVRSGRVNPGLYPIGFSLPDTTDLKQILYSEKMKEWWTPEWRSEVEKGMFFQRDVAGGQMSRDMTIFIDEDGKAYHV